jgi:hypothetical protein
MALYRFMMSKSRGHLGLHFPCHGPLRKVEMRAKRSRLLKESDGKIAGL